MHPSTIIAKRLILVKSTFFFFKLTISHLFYGANTSSIIALSSSGIPTAPLRKTIAPLLLYTKLITSNSEDGKQRARLID